MEQGSNGHLHSVLSKFVTLQIICTSQVIISELKNDPEWLVPCAFYGQKNKPTIRLQK